MNTNSLAEKIVEKLDSMTIKIRWDNAHKEARQLLTQVRDYRKQLLLGGILWSWNGCEQMFYLSSDRSLGASSTFSNQVPWHVAECSVAADLHAGKKPHWYI